MDRRIIRTFKRLRVLTPNFKFQGNMDELVNDLSLALQETSCVEGRSYGGRNRRRRGRKRRSKCTSNSGEGCSNFTCKHRSCFISEDSESSLDLSSVSNRYHSRTTEMMTMDKEKCPQPSTLSDTDDLKIIHQFQQAIRISHGNENIMFGKTGEGISVGESDSVNENFSPVRPHRKRRKFKGMAVDFCPIEEKLKNWKNQLPTSVNQLIAESQSNLNNSQPATLTFGKRKRSERGLEVLENCEIDAASEMSSPSASNCTSRNPVFNNTESSISSSESDTDLLKRDEGREADDEQSDFFFESGPVCGIPGVKSHWNTDHEDSEETNTKIEQLLNGCTENFTSPAQTSYHYNLQRFNNMHTRNIRTGHRRLPAANSLPSSVTSIDDMLSDFLQDPNQNILPLPPLNKREKEQLLNFASVCLLKVICEGHGRKKQAYLVKTANNIHNYGASSSSENSSNFPSNNVFSDIKRRRKVSNGKYLKHFIKITPQ
ncbi:G patch domain-containing protein 2-like [Nymphon striatum]|nr:G patch domain-containing protein 2-like [Nymphon striatum]